MASKLAPSTKIMWLKATCSMRLKVMVDDPHSRSITPLTSLPTRSAGVTGTQASRRADRSGDCLSAATICRHRSTEYPVGLPSLSRKENGGDVSRCPRWMTPVSRSFSSVGRISCAPGSRGQGQEDRDDGET